MARLRMSRSAVLSAATATALLLLGSTPVAVAEPSELRRTARLLPIPPGGFHSFVKELNSSGTIVGRYYTKDWDGPFATRWNAGRPGYTLLAPLPGERFSSATALSNRGWAVGLSYDSEAEPHPVRWTPGATPTRLALPDGSRSGNASDVNNSGVVVGDAAAENKRSHPLRWQPDGSRTGLPVLPGDDSGTATSINRAGTAVGWTEKRDADGAAGPAHPVRWNAAGAVSALPLPAGFVGARTSRITDNGVVFGHGRRAGSTEYDRVLVWAADGGVRDAGRGRGYDVNRAGTAVGASLEDDPNGDTARWNADGTRTVLANPAETAGEVLAINNRGTAVGYAWPPAAPALDKALLWKPDGTVVPLPPSPLGPYAAAFAINDAGVVAGFSVGTDGAGNATNWRATVWKR